MPGAPQKRKKRAREKPPFRCAMPNAIPPRERCTNQCLHSERNDGDRHTDDHR